MNDESNQGLEPVANDALEARLVAWVLGEASAFEATELEKLYRQDREVALFVDRLRLLDGLIKNEEEEVWRLPVEKRATVLALFDDEAPKVAQRSQRHWWSIAAAAIVMFIAIGGALAPMAIKQAAPLMKESAVIVSYSAAMEEPAALASGRASNLDYPTEYEPPELPNSVAPEGVIISGSRNGDGAITRNSVNDRLKREDSIFPVTPATPTDLDDDEEVASQFLAGGVVAEAGRGSDERMDDPFVGSSDVDKVLRREFPAKQSSSSASVIGSNSVSPSAVPVPEVSIPEVGLAFGDGDDFGAGWGGSVGGGELDGGVPTIGDLPGLGRLFQKDGERSDADPFASKAPAVVAKEDQLGLDAAIKPKPTEELRYAIDGQGPAITGGMAADLSSLGERDAQAEEFGMLESNGRGEGGGQAKQPVDSKPSSETFDTMGQESLVDRAWNSPTPSEDHDENIDKVRRDLYRGQGHYDLGQLDEAKKQYEEVLRTDPTNSAARRGLEKVADSKSSYYRAAYDQTRSELLSEVDAAWELAVPADGDDFEGFANYGTPIAGDATSPIDFKESGASAEVAEDLVTRTITVPSDFMSRLAKGGADSGDIDRGEIDPFAAPEEVAAILPRMSMYELLKQNGVSFGPDTTVQFSAGTSTLLVRNTASNLDLVEQLANSMASEVLLEGPLVRMDEISAADDPFSTFSLHVSDTSFKLASAAMERGEVPDAESIRPEEFYNAFDYGDPSPANGEPVACVIEQSAHPAFPQRNLMRVAVRTGSAGRANTTPLNLTLLLDNSGSMEREDRAEGVSNAVEQLASLLQAGDKVTVAGFSRQPRLLVDRLDGGQAAHLNGVVAQLPSEGGTNLEDALVLGEELAKRQFVEGAQNRVVLFTDGAANLGDADPESLNDRIETLRRNGIAFDAAGFGADGLNDRLLERLSRNGNGRYYVVDDPGDANEGFADKLAGAFRPEAENVKVQVVFNPSRVGNYKLIGFEKHRLKKEDFRNDSVDAAEMASEEAGVALYQFEVLPEGEGEIGEVSVRFRDVASGQMVERTWTIPYDSAAPAFDQAAESLQLAGLAAFAAEKLRSAPMAEVVDFQELAPVLGRVSARYPDDARIARLRRMIEQLR